MRSAALAERHRVEREVDRLASHEARLSDELARLRTRREELAEQLLVLNRFVVGRSAAPARDRSSEPLASTNGSRLVLKGAQIREVAIRVLASSPAANAPLHYRRWYETVVSEGYEIAGKDPLASFLTQVSRSPLVARAGAAGHYLLDLSFPLRGRRELARLRSELRETHESPDDSSPEALARVRQRREELVSQIERCERKLEEASRSLGERTDNGQT